MAPKNPQATLATHDVPEVLDPSHRDILVHLDKLVALTGRLRNPTRDDALRQQSRDLIAFFSGPARDHNYDEEQHVFPRFLRGDDADTRRETEGLREDHAWIELYWLDIEAQLASVAQDSGAIDQELLQSATQIFVALMGDHIALEESLLYPQLKRQLKLKTARPASREMAARRAGKLRGSANGS